MKLVLLIFAIPIIANCQELGIKFEQNLSWQEIKERAKLENKYIFVDCFSTWCLPCKRMEKEVYVNDSVGRYVNANFISTKIQIDTSRKDDELTKNRYALAHAIQKEYKVFIFPTYLFFSPDGKIVHKAIGFKNPNDFLLITYNAINPYKQYYTLLEDYLASKKDYSIMPYLANTAKLLEEKELALQIARDYMKNHLEKLNLIDFFTKSNLDFIGSFSKMLTSKDKAFKIYYNNSLKVDEILNHKGYSKQIVDYIITKEDITPFISEAKFKNSSPNWKRMGKRIASKYNSDFAIRNIINAKVAWFKEKQRWKDYTKFIIIQVEKTGIANISNDMWGAFYLNNNAWNVFQYSCRKRELRKALEWSSRAVQIDTSYLQASNIDTKANILYKLGRNNEAIALEERAAKLDPKNKDITNALKKMKEGKITWIVPQE